MKRFYSSLLIVAIMASMSGCKWFGYGDDTGPVGPPIPPAGTRPGEDLVIDMNNDKDGWKPETYEIAGQPGDFIVTAKQPLSSIYFAYNREVIGTAEQNKLNSVAKLMNERPEVCLIIEGNCDDRGSVEFNRALGERRAIAVKDYFLNKGLSEDRFKTISYGEERPAVEGTDATARAKNRRADLVPATRR